MIIYKIPFKISTCFPEDSEDEGNWKQKVF